MKPSTKRLQAAFLILLVFTFLFGTRPLRAELAAEAQDAIESGKTAAKQRNYLEAIKDFEIARKLAPDEPKIYYFLGLAESNIPGRELRAVCWFKAYLAINPEASNAKLLQTKINELDGLSRTNAIQMINTLQTMVSKMSGEPKNYVYICWMEVVGLWLGLNDVPGALKTLNFENHKNQTYAIQQIVEYQSNHDDIEGAEKTLKLFDRNEGLPLTPEQINVNRFLEIHALESFVGALVKRGEVSEAKNYIHKALKISDSVVDTHLLKKSEDQDELNKTLESLNSSHSPTPSPNSDQGTVTFSDWLAMVSSDVNPSNSVLNNKNILDQGDSLKSLPPSDDLPKLYYSLRLIIDDVVSGQKAVDLMLKK